MSMIRTLSFNGATTLGLPIASSLDPREIIQQEQVNCKSTCQLFLVYIKAQNESCFSKKGKNDMPVHALCLEFRRNTFVHT